MKRHEWHQNAEETLSLRSSLRAKRINLPSFTNLIDSNWKLPVAAYKETVNSSGHEDAACYRLAVDTNSTWTWHHHSRSVSGLEKLRDHKKIRITSPPTSRRVSKWWRWWESTASLCCSGSPRTALTLLLECGGVPVHAPPAPFNRPCPLLHAISFVCEYPVAMHVF